MRAGTRSTSLAAIVIAAIFLYGCASFRRPPSEPPPPQLPTTACAERDDDRDGVGNCDDSCPATPPGVAVGPDGCPAMAPVDEDTPRFPAKPPPPSDSAQLLNADVGITTGSSLGEVDDAVCAALRRADYADLGHYLYPGGFALVARLERIHPDGRPFSGIARWLPYAQPMTLATFDVARYLRMLVNADQGYYRLVVFIVSDRPIVFSDAVSTSRFVDDFSNPGATSLPQETRAGTYGGNHRITVLVYEMTQRAVGRPAISTRLGLTARQHLERSRVMVNSVIARH